MPKFEVEWLMRGTATVEADDRDEAEQIVTDALRGFETYPLEEYDVDDTECVDVQEVGDDDDVS